MKKIIFIAFYFNQTNEIASKRLQGLAKYLPQFGWEPIVIVPKINNIPLTNFNTRIVETDYEDMLDKFLPKKIHNKKNTQDTQDNNQSSFKNKAISIAGELFAYPDGMKYWYKPAISKSKEVIETENIQGIISSSFPITAHIIAHDLKKQYDIPWIADLRDLWNLNPYISHNFIRSYFEKRLEKKTFENANVLTTTTKIACETLKTLHPKKKIVSIVSGYDPEDFKKIEFNKNSDKLRFMYAGSLYNGKRDPSLLFEAISQLINEKKINPSKIAIDFYGDKYNLLELSKKYNLESVVNINGKIPHSDVLKKQMESDVLLLISWMNKKEKMFIPGKIYEYIGSKKPILSIGYEKGSLKDLIQETNLGYHVSNLKDTKIAIFNYYKDYIKNNKVKYLANEKVSEYSMINTAKNFGKLLNEENK